MSRIPHGKAPSPRLSLVHLGVVFFLFAFLGALLFVASGFYVAHWTSPAARSISHVFPMPVASVNGEKIFYDDVAELALLIETTGAEDPFLQALETLIRRKEIEQLGEQLGVDVPVSEMSVDQDLKNQLGWSDKQYRKYVLEPLAVAQAVELALYDSEKYQQPAHLQAEGLLADIEFGIDFTDLARQHSDGGAAYLGGDIGYITKDQLEEGLHTLFNLNTDEVSVILEADRYFAIGKAYDVVMVDDVREQVGLQIISVNKLSLPQVMESYAAEQKVKVWLR